MNLNSLGDGLFSAGLGAIFLIIGGILLAAYSLQTTYGPVIVAVLFGPPVVYCIGSFLYFLFKRS